MAPNKKLTVAQFQRFFTAVVVRPEAHGLGPQVRLDPAGPDAEAEGGVAQPAPTVRPATPAPAALPVIYRNAISLAVSFGVAVRLGAPATWGPASPLSATT